METAKKDVHDFWDSSSCGEDLYLQDAGKAGFLRQSEARYELEPYILTFADFKRYKDQKVLEIGIGLGADHQEFADAGAILYGIDLTERAIAHTSNRFKIFGCQSLLQKADCENLPFGSDVFDLVYSWGALHHTPDTPKAIAEVHRVLKPGGTVKAMIYHKHSLVGYMLWIRYALLAFKPLTGLDDIYANYLESPGTQAFTVADARRLFAEFKHVTINCILTHADLLTSAAGQRHESRLLRLARNIWPRWLLRMLCPQCGLFMTVKGVK